MNLEGGRALVTNPGSSRLASLLRIMLVLIAFSKYSSHLRPFDELTPVHWFMGAWFFMAGVAMLAGFWSRLSTALFGACLAALYYGYALWLNDRTFVHHHTYMLMASILLLALTPCGGSFSVDRWLLVRRSTVEQLPVPAERGDNWALWLIGFQVCMSYLYGAWDKSHMGFLSGDRMEHHFAYLYVGSDLPQSALFHGAMTGLAVTTVAWEYALVALLWVRRWHWWVMPANLLFHGLIYYCLPVSTFTVTMWALMLVFVDPDALHRFFDSMLDPPTTPLDPTAS